MTKREIQNHPEIFEREETLIPYHKAHKHFPNETSPSSIYRWSVRGISTPHGHIHLETAVIGGRRFTSEEAIRRFLRVQQGRPAAQTNVAPLPVIGMSKREQEREMRRLGLRSQQASTAEQSKTDSSDKTTSDILGRK